MADFSGIEAVTSTLRQILRDRSRETPTVTTAPPDVDVPDTEPPVVNLFLYRVGENAAVRNQQLPARVGPPALAPPPLALDLSYLVTATGLSPTDDRGAHRVLGDAMLTLHDHALVPKDDPLLDPGLRNEVELLKITLEPLDVEDLSKIWTASTAPYRLAVGYRVTVVQLASTLPPRIVRPVGEPPDAGPRVGVVPMDRPVIDAVRVVRRLPDGTDGPEQPVAYARIGERLVLVGRRLHPGTRVLLDEVEAVVDASSTPDRVVVAVPDDPALQAGVHRVRVVRDVTVGDPPDDRAVPLMHSGVAAFVLVPTVDAVAPPQGPAGTTVTVTGTRLLRANVPTVVLVGATVLTPEPGATDGQLQVTVAGPAPGIHPLGVRVAGADSIDPVTFEVTP